jgi:hypothetical protein
MCQDEGLQFTHTGQECNPHVVWLQDVHQDRGNAYVASDLKKAVGWWEKRKSWSGQPDGEPLASFVVYLDNGETGIGSRPTNKPGAMLLSKIELHQPRPEDPRCP